MASSLDFNWFLSSSIKDLLSPIKVSAADIMPGEEQGKPTCGVSLYPYPNLSSLNNPLRFHHEIMYTSLMGTVTK